MGATVSIFTDAEQAYPTPADSERGANERGWFAAWHLVTRGVNGQVWHGPYEDEDEALEQAIRLAEDAAVDTVQLRQQSGYDREQVAAERAFEARYG